MASLLLDHYTPAAADPPRPYSHTTVTKLQLLSPGVRVTANEDGTLTVHDPLGSLPTWRLIRVEPLLFHQGDGQGYVAFETDPAGRITRMYLPPYVLALDRVP